MLVKQELVSKKNLCFENENAFRVSINKLIIFSFYNFLFLIPCFCLRCNFKSYRHEQLKEQLVQLNWLGFFFGRCVFVIRFEELEEGVEGWEVEVVVVVVVVFVIAVDC